MSIGFLHNVQPLLQRRAPSAGIEVGYGNEGVSVGINDRPPLTGSAEPSSPTKQSIKFHEKLSVKKAVYDHCLKALNETLTALEIANSNYPDRIENVIDHEKKIQDLLEIKEVRIRELLKAHDALTTGEHPLTKEIAKKERNQILNKQQAYDLKQFDLSLLENYNQVIKILLVKDECFARCSANRSYVESFLKFSSAYEQWMAHWKTLYSSESTDEDKAISLVQLKELQSTLLLDISSLDALSGKSSLSLGVDWSSLQKQILANQEELAFYQLSDEETRAQLEGLRIRSAARDHFSKSMQYQIRLFAHKKLDCAIAEANRWLLNAFDMATEQEILQIGEYFIRAYHEKQMQDAAAVGWSAEKNKALQAHKDLFLRRLESWLDLHPNCCVNLDHLQPMNLGEEMPIPSAFLILRGTLYSLSQDLSFTALSYYKGCAEIMPEQKVWQWMLAMGDVANLNWQQAKARLADLPEDQAAFVRQFMVNTQYQTAAAAGEVLSVIANHVAEKLLKSRSVQRGGQVEHALKLFQRTCPLITHPIVSDLWISRFVISYPEELQKVISAGLYEGVYSRWNQVSLGCQVLRDLALLPILGQLARTPSVRLLAKHRATNLLTAISTGIEFRHACIVLVSGGNAIDVLDTGSQIARVSNVVQPLLSLGEMSSALVGYEIPSSVLACVRTTRVAIGNLAIIRLTRRCSPLIVGGARYAVTRLGVEALVIGTESTLALARIGAGTAVTAVEVGLAAYTVLREFPKIYAACVLEKAGDLCQSSNYEKAQEFLNEVKNRWGIDRKSIELYANCIPSMQMIAEINPKQVSETEAARVKNAIIGLDLALSAFRGVEAYDVIWSFISNYKIEGFFIVKDYEGLRLVFEDSKKSQKDVEDALAQFLLRVNFDREGASRECESIAVAFSMDSHKNILREYGQYFLLRQQNPEPTPPKAEEILAKISNLKSLIQPIDGFAANYQALEYDELVMCLAAHKPDRAKVLCRELPLSFHQQLMYELFQGIEEMKNSRDIGCQKLKQITDTLESFAYRDLALKYRTYLESLPIRLDHHSSSEEIEERLGPLNELIAVLEDKAKASHWQKGEIWKYKMVLKKFHLYLQLDKYKEAFDFLEPIKFPSQVEQLFSLSFGGQFLENQKTVMNLAIQNSGESIYLDAAFKKLNQVLVFSRFSSDILLRAYAIFLNKWREAMFQEPSSIKRLESAGQALNKLERTLSEKSICRFSWMQGAKKVILFRTIEIEMGSGKWSSALNACQSIEAILIEEGDGETLRYIAALKRDIQRETEN